MTSSLSLLEINDSGLRLSRDSELLLESPGFAHISAQGLLLGEQARRKARLQPLQINSQFWQRIDLEPLNSDNPKCRHNADLVFEHLQAIKALQSDISKLVLAIPANYTPEQLSLLLGVAEHCQLSIVGLVDTAVAAVAQQSRPGRHYYIDMHLHQSMITRIDVDGDIRNTEMEAVTSAGLLACYEQWANLIAEQFIQQTRFNPLHDASVEQELYNQLPDFLQRCQRDGEALLSFSGHQANIALDILEAKTRPLFEEILSRMGNHSGQIFVSDRCQHLPGFSEVFSQAIAIKAQALPESIKQFQNNILGGDKGLQLIKSLPLAATNSNTEAPQEQADASHLLWNNQAYAVGAALYLNASNDKVLDIQARDGDVCCLKSERGKLQLQGINLKELLVNGRPAQEGQWLIPGDKIKVATVAQPFTVIALARDFEGAHGA